MSVNLDIAAQRFPEPRVVLELLKPITWFPPMWVHARMSCMRNTPPGFKADRISRSTWAGLA